MALSIYLAVLATFCSGVIIFLERAFPFALFSRRNPPAIIRFIEKYIPPMVMAALLFYCLKDISFFIKVDNITTTNLRGFLPYISGVFVTVVLHLWKKNSLLSICSGTVIYMILIRVL